MNEPRIVCACCQQREITVYEVVCPDCRAQLERAGVVAPGAPQPRIQIGPLDV